MRFHQSNHLCKSGKTVILVCPFRTTLSNLFDRKFLISSNKSPEIPKDLILNIKPGNQILSNALDTSKNTARISFGRSQSKFEKNSWFIERSWFPQESNGRKPD